MENRWNYTNNDTHYSTMDNSRNNYDKNKNFSPPQQERKYSQRKVENVKIISSARAPSFKKARLNSSRISKFSNAQVDNSFLQRSFQN